MVHYRSIIKMLVNRVLGQMPGVFADMAY